MRNNLDTTSLERAFNRLVRQCGVSTHIYNNRPKSAVKVDEFVVVSVSGSIVDMGGYGTATIGVDLFAKDLNNFKNNQRLQYMYDMLIRNMPYKFDFADGDFDTEDYDEKDFMGGRGSFLIDGHPNILGDSADDYGFTARLINFKIIIKTN